MPANGFIFCAIAAAWLSHYEKTDLVTLTAAHCLLVLITPAMRKGQRHEATNIKVDVIKPWKIEEQAPEIRLKNSQIGTELSILLDAYFIAIGQCKNCNMHAIRRPPSLSLLHDIQVACNLNL